MQFTQVETNVRYNNTSFYGDFLWINRMTSAWTIEGWFRAPQTGDYN
jgi:hypothetical protein